MDTGPGGPSATPDKELCSGVSKKRAALLSATGASLVAGCLVLLNLVANQLYLRLDLSAGRLYSLSPGSKRILKGLSDPVEVRAYFTQSLPPQFALNRTYLEDLLKEFRRASRGKVHFRFVDVDKDPATKQEAVKQGITPVQFNVISRDKYEVREGLMGLVLQYEDKKETLPVLAKIEALEYDLTSRLLRLTRTKRKILGMFASHGALTPEGLNPGVRENLERNYDLRPVDLSAGTTVPAEVSALLVLGLTEKLSDFELYALDQFLLSGRGLALGVDTQKTDLNNFLVSQLDTGLVELLKHYGFELKRSLVLDAQSQKVSISQSRGYFMLTNIVDFPLFIIATDLSREHPATRHLDSLNLPMASPIEVDPKLGGIVQVLARSSKLSWQRAAWNRGLYSINPLEGFPMDPKDPKGPFTLAVAATGRFESYFSTASASAHPLPKGANPKTFLPVSSGESRLILVGTSRFANPQLPPEDSGPVFLMNLADSLALDADLIAIRSKGAVFRPLMEVSPAAKAAVRWANVLLPPCFVAFSGIARLHKRRRLRFKRIKNLMPPAADGTQNS